MKSKLLLTKLKPESEVPRRPQDTHELAARRF